MVWVVDRVFGFHGYFLCLVGCFSMIISTPAVLSVLYAYVFYFCICTCSAQLSMFHMERRSRNTLIIIIIFPTNLFNQCHYPKSECDYLCVGYCGHICESLTDTATPTAGLDTLDIKLRKGLAHWEVSASEYRWNKIPQFTVSLRAYPVFLLVALEVYAWRPSQWHTCRETMV